MILSYSRHVPCGRKASAYLAIILLKSIALKMFRIADADDISACKFDESNEISHTVYRYNSRFIGPTTKGDAAQASAN